MALPPPGPPGLKTATSFLLKKSLPGRLVPPSEPAGNIPTFLLLIPPGSPAPLEGLPVTPEKFPLAENIGPGHAPRHGSVTGTATERQQPLPCRLQAPAGNAAVFPGQAPRFGEPFFLVTLPGLSEASGDCFPRRQEKYRLPGKEPSLPSGLAICGLLVYGSSFIEAHSGSGPGCPAMRYGAFFVVFRSWGRGRRQAGLQGLGRCGRSQPFWRIEKWLTSA